MAILTSFLAPLLRFTEPQKTTTKEQKMILGSPYFPKTSREGQTESNSDYQVFCSSSQVEAATNSFTRVRKTDHFLSQYFDNCKSYSPKLWQI